MGTKIKPRNMIPAVNPAPCPNAFDIWFLTRMVKTIFTIGIKNKIVYHPGRSAILHRIEILYIYDCCLSGPACFVECFPDCGNFKNDYKDINQNNYAAHR